MAHSPEEKLKYIIAYERDEKIFEFHQWFLQQFESDIENCCTLEEFAVYFLNTLRQYADAHLKTNSTETPKCQTPVKTMKSNRDDTFAARRLSTDSSKQDISATSDNHSIKVNHSKNNSCCDFEMISTPKQSTSADRLSVSHNLTSTPVRRNTPTNSRRLSGTSTYTNKGASSSLCLGDFLVLDTPTNSRSSKKKSTPNSNQQSSQKTQNEKPKKRVQPISISKRVEKSANSSSIFAGGSSFSNENNILKISNNELEDKEQCAILAARKSLAMNASEITKEIKDVSIALTNSVSDMVTIDTPLKELTTDEIPLDIKSLQNNMTLQRLAHTYALIIDLNLVTNILNELSFLLNLLNVSIMKDPNVADGRLCTQKNDLSMLEDASNAMYFALLCLEHEKLALASLDAKSLGVVLINERFYLLNDNVKTFLTDVYQRKQTLSADNPFHDDYLCYDSKTCNNVYFQHEHDSRENFTSNQEFINFRAQRDLFYKCLQIWESNNLNPNWRFSSEITPVIREIFYMSEHCINMAHLAKLFVSQLLLSASSPEDIGLDVDHLKLSKLTQRLIAPSQFSVDYQFPRTEAFFRDFIVEARSLAFAEQLKMELYSQLTMLNDSTLDHINITKTESEADDRNVSLTDGMPCFIVKPDILSSLLKLAKFLGFTVALPYCKSSSNLMPAKVEQNQLRLRSLMQNNFDVHILLVEAFDQGKLLIVIPWLVQYFAMLDNITLHLKNYMKVLKLLFALYYFMGSENVKPFNTTSVFTIKLCLGWLFESKQMIAEEYYNYRVKLKGNSMQESTSELEFIKGKWQFHSNSAVTSDSFDPNARLEALLPIACPFLAEFRVAIMPAKYAQTKLASRTGRYRHITTRIAELPSAAAKQIEESPLTTDQTESKKTQNSLIQAFLRCQTSSTLQIIKFCTERCYKSTVKDGQLKILVPAKASADNLVNEIDSFQYHFVYNSIKAIYADAYVQVKDGWKKSMPEILRRRISTALDSLLPEETSSILKETYLMIIEKESSIKMTEWFFANITESYFCSDLQETAEKICNANKSKVQLGSNQLTIVSDTPSVSDLLGDLQYWLHCTSMRIDRFKDSKPIVKLLNNFIKTFENELPYFLYHLIGTDVIRIVQNIINKNCAHMTAELVEAVSQVFSHPNMLKALNSSSLNAICIYDGLVNKRFIDSLGTRKECFYQLELLIINIIKREIITVNYANDLFVSLFKYDFDPIVLNEISNMLKNIAQETADVPSKGKDSGAEDGSDDGIEKSGLFMEMLADLSRDVDYL